MSNMKQTFAAMAAAYIGRAVEVADPTGGAVFKIAKLSDKIGTLKDGTKGEYVVLQKVGNENIVINVHPQSAKRLMTKGVEAGMTLMPAEGESRAAEPAGKMTEAQYQHAALTAAAEMDDADNKASAETPAEAPAAPAADKAPSKRALFMTAFKAVVGEVEAGTLGATEQRKTVKARVADLSLSDAGFNTYYQNCRSGKWI